MVRPPEQSRHLLVLPFSSLLRQKISLDLRRLSCRLWSRSISLGRFDSRRMNWSDLDQSKEKQAFHPWLHRHFDYPPYHSSFMNVKFVWCMLTKRDIIIFLWNEVVGGWSVAARIFRLRLTSVQTLQIKEWMNQSSNHRLTARRCPFAGLTSTHSTHSTHSIPPAPSIFVRVDYGAVGGTCRNLREETYVEKFNFRNFPFTFCSSM